MTRYKEAYRPDSPGLLNKVRCEKAHKLMEQFIESQPFSERTERALADKLGVGRSTIRLLRDRIPDRLSLTVLAKLQRITEKDGMNLLAAEVAYSSQTQVEDVAEVLNILRQSTGETARISSGQTTMEVTIVEVILRALLRRGVVHRWTIRKWESHDVDDGDFDAEVDTNLDSC